MIGIYKIVSVMEKVSPGTHSARTRNSILNPLFFQTQHSYSVELLLIGGSNQNQVS